MCKRVGLSLAFLCLVVCTNPVFAALINRGTGMIYDTELDITWLQDANYARTSGYDSDGLMIWDQALTWAGDLVYGGYDDWRLPQILPVNGTNYNDSYLSVDGSTDYGYNISAPGTVYAGSKGSEMAYMYYSNLGNNSVVGTHIHGAGLVNTGDFINLGETSYWSGTDYYSTQYARYFDMGNGVQSYVTKDGSNCNGGGLYAWAVRDGDFGPYVSSSVDYVADLTLSDTFSFDYYWQMGQEPDGFNMDIFYFIDNSWRLLGGDITFDGSLSEWETASFVVPEALRGLQTQIRFGVFDFGEYTDPTVYLRNIASNGTAPVPEPATIILLGTGMLGIAGFRKKLKKQHKPF